MRDYNKHKFDFHSSKCIFIGYSPLHKGYNCLHPSGRVYIVRHVTFDETCVPSPLFDDKTNTSPCVFESVKSFNQQQVFHLSTLPYIPDSSFEELFSTGTSSNRIQSLSSSDHRITAQQNQQYDLLGSRDYTQTPIKNNSPVSSQIFQLEPQNPILSHDISTNTSS